MSTKKKSVSTHPKRAFLRGLAVLLPSVLTLWLMVKAYQFVDSAIAQPINGGIKLIVIKAPNYFPSASEFFAIGPTEEVLSEAASEKNVSLDNEKELLELKTALRTQAVNTWWDAHRWMNLLGLLVAAIIVYISGRLVGGWLGRTAYKRIEKIMVAVPVIRKVYPYIKQLVDFLINDNETPKFSSVVAVQYPRKGIWSVGFLTGPTLQKLEQTSPDSVTIFIPSSPTPFTGYTITVPRKDTLDLPISVEEAIRFSVSGGVLVPDHQLVRGSGVPARMTTPCNDSNENLEYTQPETKERDTEEDHPECK
ncbi:MAG: DUF502 domain-containing protein [Phycisphaerales bacterium]|jgi:uncharacterized membrane protein|nr:DUF502 domain-containing protein [Phycisphaerales bacterium]